MQISTSHTGQVTELKISFQTSCCLTLCLVYRSGFVYRMIELHSYQNTVCGLYVLLCSCMSLTP